MDHDKDYLIIEEKQDQHTSALNAFTTSHQLISSQTVLQLSLKILSPAW